MIQIYSSAKTLFLLRVQNKMTDLPGWNMSNIESPTFEEKITSTALEQFEQPVSADQLRTINAAQPRLEPTTALKACAKLLESQWKLITFLPMKAVH